MQNEATAIWTKACRHLAGILSKDVYDRWIAQIVAIGLDETTLLLSVANDFYQSWLEENYLSLIEDAVTSVTGRKLKIGFAVDRNSVIVQEEDQRKRTRELVRRIGKRRPPKPNLNPKYLFDSFVVGPSNNFAHAAALAVAQSPARAYNPLFIYGGVGLGKTHLMQAIGHFVLSKSRAVVSYVSCETFTNEYIDALQKKGITEFRRRYRTVDVLLIDDIHFLAGKERMQEEFFHTFNALFENQKQIVLTSDRPASEIPGLEHRLVSRFEWGLVTELETPDVETRIAILRRKKSDLNLELDDDVLQFIAEHVRLNIRRLEGALIRAASYSSLTGQHLDIPTLEYLLRDTLDPRQEQTVTIERIQKVVADYFDVRLGDMSSKRRPKNIAFPRQVAMYLCRRMTDQSLPAIGNAFGRNHATVIHACRVIDHHLKDDPSLRRTLEKLQARVTGND